MAATLATRDPGFEARFRGLLEAKRESAADVDAAVAAIIEDVRRRGDAALIDYTRRFDGVDLSARGIRLTREPKDRPHRSDACSRLARRPLRRSTRSG